jgi:hypothetical protein
MKLACCLLSLSGSVLKYKDIICVHADRDYFSEVLGKPDEKKPCGAGVAKRRRELVAVAVLLSDLGLFSVSRCFRGRFCFPIPAMTRDVGDSGDPPSPLVIPDWRRFQRGHPKSSQIGVHLSDRTSIGVGSMVLASCFGQEPRAKSQSASRQLLFAIC